MRIAWIVVASLALFSCSNRTPPEESDTVEAYRLMLGAADADLCITSLHMLALNRKNLERGTFEPHDRAVIQENEGAVRRLKDDFVKSLSLYKDEQRRSRDGVFLPFFEITIECHERFLEYADTRSAESQEKYVACQKRFTTFIQQARAMGPE